MVLVWALEPSFLGWLPTWDNSQKDFKIVEANINGTLNTMRTDIERVNTDAAKRSDAQTKWMIGIVVVATIIFIGVLG